MMYFPNSNISLIINYMRCLKKWPGKCGINDDDDEDMMEDIQT